MMKYILMRSISAPGYRDPHTIVDISDDLDYIKLKLSSLVKSGVPVGDLRIVRDIPFEFQCTVKLNDEEDAQ